MINKIFLLFLLFLSIGCSKDELYTNRSTEFGVFSAERNGKESLADGHAVLFTENMSIHSQTYFNHPEYNFIERENLFLSEKYRLEKISFF